MSTFLSNFIEYVKTVEGSLVFLGVIVAIIGVIAPIYFGRKSKHIYKGGHGGNAKVTGLNSTAIGGKGGGGDGGHAEVTGDNSFAIGGEGGEAGQLDRGGKGGRGPLHVLMEDYPYKAKEIFDTFGITEQMAKTVGKGGDGASPTSQ